MNHFNRDAEKALSAFDQTHGIKLNYSYELPFGPGKPFVTTGALSKIVGHDPLPYGIEPNRQVLESLIRHATTQGIIPHPIPVNELFAASTHTLTA